MAFKTREKIPGDVNMCTPVLSIRPEACTGPQYSVEYECRTCGFSARACTYFRSFMGSGECRNFGPGGCTCRAARKAADERMSGIVRVIGKAK